MESLSKLEEILGYKFKDIDLLKKALTHPSYKNENAEFSEDYQRMEFLGDAAIGFAVSMLIFNKCPSFNEGQLTKLKAEIVCENGLATLARKLELGSFIFIGKGEKISGGLERNSILADTFEAVLASICLDGGFDAFIKAWNKITKKTITKSMAKNIDSDYKTHFQQICQREIKIMPRYVMTEEKGPDHDKIFIVSLKINKSMISQGKGHSKKEAEQDAARKAIKLFENGKMVDG